MYKILAEQGKYCTGCAACANICPVDAISMTEDPYGFPQAVILHEKCIDCGACMAVCPVLNENKNQPAEAPACLAVMADDEVRFQSSSGGAFYVLAKKVLQNGGLAVGASLEEDGRVRHIMVDSMENLRRLQKSKYTQSDIGDIFRKIKEQLMQKKTVLFSGCPCQVAGLKAYLGKDYENLLLIDILCHGVPSQKMLWESLQEYETEHSITGMDFRDKDYGWDSLRLTLEYDDGTKRNLSYDESRYEQGFHPGMTLRDSCYDCKFCEFPREGDLSIGDFWNVEKYDETLHDGKGTSLVFINSEKGQKFFETCREEFMTVREVPVEYAEQNRIHAKTPRDPARDYFLTLYPQRDFNTAVFYAQQNKFDIGLVGNWSYPNYGSELTYYALYRLLKRMGKSVLMLSWPKQAQWKPYETPQLFRENPYEAYEIASLPETRDDMRQYNDRCETFILGSDQLLNNNLYRWFDKFMQLDWVQQNKRKIAYAASFGCDYIWGSDDDRAELALFLQKFDAFSVREESALQLAETYYGRQADLVLDPVFLLPDEEYRKLAEKYEDSLTQKSYVFSYILDTSKEKADIIQEGAKQLGMEIIAAKDGSKDSITDSNMWNLPTVYDLSVEEWLAYIKNCSFMITDSFHGMCFAIIFRKPFIAISNSARGKTRFDTILGHLHLQERLVNSENELKSRMDLFRQPIDYDAVYQRLEVQKTASEKWLADAVFGSQEYKTMSEYDILMGKLSGTALELREASATNRTQWEQLEDHRLRLDGLDAHAADLRKELDVCRERMQETEKRMQETEKRMQETEKRMQEAEQRYQELNQQVTRIQNAAPFRMYRALVKVPRKILRFFRKGRK